MLRMRIKSGRPADQSEAFYRMSSFSHKDDAPPDFGAHWLIDELIVPDNSWLALEPKGL